MEINESSVFICNFQSLKILMSNIIFRNKYFGLNWTVRIKWIRDTKNYIDSDWLSYFYHLPQFEIGKLDAYDCRKFDYQ